MAPAATTPPKALADSLADPSATQVVVRARLTRTTRAALPPQARPLKAARPLDVAATANITAETPTSLRVSDPTPSRRRATTRQATPIAGPSLAARSLVVAHRLREATHAAATSALLAPRRHGRPASFGVPALPGADTFRRLGHDRTVALAVAGIVLAASTLSLAPAVAGGHAGDGAVEGAVATPRLAIGGSAFDASGIGDVEALYADDVAAAPEAATPGQSDAERNALARLDDIEFDDAEARALAAEVVDAKPSSVAGPFLSDGTLLKPVAVDTEVADGSGLMETYKVKSGDTLSGIAKHFGVSMMTLWWANDLKSKDDLHLGQKLQIPPVTGLLIEVKSGDTLAELATEYKLDEEAILQANDITDPNLVIGQVLILPGAKGDAIPTPKPPKKHTTAKHHSSGGGKVSPPRSYGGGNFKWPTTSHHISQLFHYGHYAIDIDGNTGDPIWAAAGGTVTFAGWKSNGGGYQVWIAHGSGLYTTYNHMSSVSVSRGQHVGRGHRLGRMGATGDATGSHLHFEVWKGPIWNGGRRVNPLAYL